MSKSFVASLILAAASLAVLIFVLPNHAAPDTQPSAQPDAADPITLVGKPAPDFTLNDPSGKPHTLSDYKGHVVVLDFWATWCISCGVERKHLTQMYQDRQDMGMVVFAIDTNDDQSKVPAFIAENNITLPVLLDPVANKTDDFGKVGLAYKVDQMPETVIIGKDGIVKDVFDSFSEDKTPPLMEKSIDAALAQ